jgi:hypothetical protein
VRDLNDAFQAEVGKSRNSWHLAWNEAVAGHLAELQIQRVGTRTPHSRLYVITAMAFQINGNI